MNSYYFRHNNITLAAVYANSEEEAWNKLPDQHSWVTAHNSGQLPNRYNTKLVQSVAGTEWQRICGDPV
jgi:hypothetical protein